MSQVTVVEAGKRKISRRVEVHAPAAELFAMVANPHRHPEIDGSGTVMDKVTGPDLLSDGAKFSVGMKQFGVPYKITSKVTAFEDGKLIEWRHPAGHRWRWEFDEKTPGVTTVTETWDSSTTPLAPVFELTGQKKANEKGITKTLEGLATKYPA